jgi:hypothetical protein
MAIRAYIQPIRKNSYWDMPQFMKCVLANHGYPSDGNIPIDWSAKTMYNQQGQITYLPKEAGRIRTVLKN